MIQPSTPRLRTIAFKTPGQELRSAVFQNCCIADFQIGRRPTSNDTNSRRSLSITHGPNCRSQMSELSLPKRSVGPPCLLETNAKCAELHSQRHVSRRCVSH